MSDDLIGRQQAIDAVEKNACNTQRIMDAVNNLPPVQPEIIRCKDCINYIDHRCTVADHHVAPFSCCQSVFGAKMKAGE